MMPDPAAIPASVLRYGRTEPLPERTWLTAGPVSLALEEGALRWIAAGGQEALRGVYVAVRDRNWGTVPARIDELLVAQDKNPDAFRVSFRARHQSGSIAYEWLGTVAGAPDGVITFRMEGRALSTFWSNRIGFCVLHPDGCAGRPCSIEHTNGRTERTAFPLAISPHQPFLDVRSISHALENGAQVSVRIEGDTFESEDQRNWTDASFKTYCTPLSLTYPVEVRAGETLRQQVTIRVSNVAGPSPRRRRADAPVRVAPPPAEALAPAPAVGLGCSLEGAPLSEREMERLRILRPAHLRVDLRLSEGTWRDRLAQAAREACLCDARLEIGIHVPEQPGAVPAEVMEALRQVEAPIARFLLLCQNPSDGVALWGLQDALRAVRPGALVAAGTDAYFAELNRARPPAGSFDALVYSVNPQVHALDDDSLMENARAQGETVRSARAFGADAPVIVSPVSLRPRFNPNATGAEEAEPDALPPSVDPRQMSLLGAAWTVASFTSLAAAGAHSITYFETAGWRGVMERDEGSPLPERFPSLPGAVFLLYHVLADLRECAGTAAPAACSDSRIAAVLLAPSPSARQRLLVANLTATPCDVEVAEWTAANLKTLDETSAERAMTEPESWRSEPGTPVRARPGAIRLRLEPYAVARLHRDGDS